MARTLTDASLVPVTLPAAMRLLEMYRGHRLYVLILFQEKDWLIVPQRKVFVSRYGWSIEDKAQIDEWLNAERGFRAFMFPDHRKLLKDPVVDCVDGRLLLRSGKKKSIPLD